MSDCEREDLPPAGEEECDAVDAEMEDRVVEVIEVEETNEKEMDEPEVKGDRYTDGMAMNPVDGTLNVMISGNVVAPLVTDGLHLLAACRAAVGITSGRYLVEFEIIQIGPQAEVRVGFSLDTASVFLGNKSTLCFTSMGQFYVDGEQLLAFRGRRFIKGDIIGLLLNRTETGNAKTVSLFVNGTRVGEPQKIPESFDGALYPHVSVKNSMVSVNFSRKHAKELPFKTRVIGDASKEDIAPTPIREVSETKIIVPVGFKTKELTEEYIVSHPNDHFVELTRDFILEWQERSNTGRAALPEETLRWFMKLMALRKRNYFFGNNHFLLGSDRQEFCGSFCGSVKKIALVSSTVISKFANDVKFADQVTLPTKEEGFSEIVYTSDQAECKEELVKWLQRCKLATKVEDLKCSEWFTEQITAYEKLREATKNDIYRRKREAAKAAAEAERADQETEKPKEEKEKEEEEKKNEEEEKKRRKEAGEVDPSPVDTTAFTEEDWMLCDLRVETHLLVHAFRSDVEDKTRISFCPEHLGHYYRLYFNAQRQFSYSTFGAQSVAEALEIIAETVTVEDGMIVTQLPKDAKFDEIIQQTEDQRQERSDRIGAGDEGANLKFKAKRFKGKGDRKGGRGNSDDGRNPRLERFNRDRVELRDNRDEVREGRRDDRPPRTLEPPRSYDVRDSRGGKSETYTMRPIPSAATSMKRDRQGSNFPPPKRMR